MGYYYTPELLRNQGVLYSWFLVPKPGDFLISIMEGGRRKEKEGRGRGVGKGYFYPGLGKVPLLSPNWDRSEYLHPVSFKDWKTIFPGGIKMKFYYSPDE